MNKQKWIVESGLYYPIPAATVLHITPGPGIFKIAQGPDPRDQRLGLLRVQEGEKFEFPGKKYSLGNESFVQRILDAWENEKFIESNKNLAIGLTGLKGAGKTYLVKEIANRLELPILILDNDFEGLVIDFITSLEFECVIIIDEAEKIFNRDNNNSHILLRLIDGVNNVTRKLYLLTTNNMNIDDNFLGRPGRLRYIKSFSSLPSETVREIIKDELLDQSKAPELMDIINSLTISTIDIVRSAIEEMNMFGSIDKTSFNLPLAPYTYFILEFDERFISRDFIPFIEESLKKVYTDEEQKKVPDFYTWMSVDDNQSKVAEVLFGNKDEWCGPLKITTTSPALYFGLTTSSGIVLEEPDKNGYFMMRSRYREENVYLCKLIRQLDSPNLYHGGMGLTV